MIIARHYRFHHSRGCLCLSVCAFKYSSYSLCLQVCPPFTYAQMEWDKHNVQWSSSIRSIGINQSELAHTHTIIQEDLQALPCLLASMQSVGCLLHPNLFIFIDHSILVRFPFHSRSSPLLSPVPVFYGQVVLGLVWVCLIAWKLVACLRGYCAAVSQLLSLSPGSSECMHGNNVNQCSNISCTPNPGDDGEAS